jgi:hypothetical protein
LKFADGGVKRDRESAFPADQIGPPELDTETMTFLGYFERIRSERDDVVMPVERQGTFQGFIEWCHFERSPAAFQRNIIGCLESSPLRDQALVPNY